MDWYGHDGVTRVDMRLEDFTRMNDPKKQREQLAVPRQKHSATQHGQDFMENETDERVVYMS